MIVSDKDSSDALLCDEPRPVGVKKAKLILNQQRLEARRVEALETIASASIKKNEILSEHTKALRAAAELKLLTIPEESLDSVSLFILKHRKEEILRQIHNSMYETSTTVYLVDDGAMPSVRSVDQSTSSDCASSHNSTDNNGDSDTS